MRLSQRLENFAIGRWFPARKAKRELADEARQLEDVGLLEEVNND